MVVLAAHGTQEPSGAPVVRAIAAAARDRLATRLEVGWLSAGDPSFDDLTAGLAADIVVPLLLGTGYHVQVDIPAVLAAHGRTSVVTPHLGPAREIIRALRDRIHKVDPDPVAVVLAAAGTSHPVGRSETRQAADMLSHDLGIPVRVAYASGAGPTVTEAVRDLREAGGRRVTVAPYLLAPGFFADRIRTAAQDSGATVAEVLGEHPGVVDLVVRRVTEAAAAIPPTPRVRAA
ncbi:sirohydrochlorin chelatase [Raineyella fluvialis]|uniref:sirohydrochlorin chelatase n=1 Tax=Raineyella fluvialis TaxID=2662261 RepID=UPI00188F6200|nr:CbiX/SirB N-terminal domain-containing protein [Raineyella fluvialis]